MNLWATKSVSALRAEAEEIGEHSLKRKLGPLNLITLGIGAIIGAGIFVLTGQAAALHAGPAVPVSMILVGIACAFAGLCYAEMASTIPVAGSAYTYAYATMGELIAWIIGWDLVLEYGVSVAAIAVGWGGYLKELLDSLAGVVLPDSIAGPPGDGGVFNAPAVFLIVAVSALLILGIRESARANSIMVVVKLAVL